MMPRAMDRQPKMPRPQANRCCDGDDCGPQVDRRDFVKTVSLGLGGLASLGGLAAPDAEAAQRAAADRLVLDDQTWPSLRVYDQAHLDRIALPIGGIGTGTVSLGGRGDLRDWEIMNRPAKGFVPRLGNQDSVRSVPRAVRAGGRAAGGLPSAGGPEPDLGVRRQPRRQDAKRTLPRFRELSIRDGVSVRPCDAVRSGRAARRRAEGVQPAGARRSPTPAASRWPSSP